MNIARWIGGSLLVAVLAACGKSEPAPAPAVPVLVVHPQDGGQAISAYPGEVRAREETVLSFRVGGNLLRREVDAGQRVREGQLLAELDVRFHPIDGLLAAFLTR